MSIHDIDMDEISSGNQSEISFEIHKIRSENAGVDSDRHVYRLSRSREELYEHRIGVVAVRPQLDSVSPSRAVQIWADRVQYRWGVAQFNIVTRTDNRGDNFNCVPGLG
jgi:hypothetical protein